MISEHEIDRAVTDGLVLTYFESLMFLTSMRVYIAIQSAYFIVVKFCLLNFYSHVAHVEVTICNKDIFNFLYGFDNLSSSTV